MILVKIHNFFKFHRILQPPRSLWRAPHAHQNFACEKQMRFAPSNVNLASKLADLGLLETAQTLQNGNPFLNPPTKLLDPTESNTSCRNSNKNYTSICELSISRSDMHACQKKTCHIQSRAKQYLKRFSSAQTLHTHIRKAHKHTPHTKNLRVYIL